jgi:hypothetical protein
MHKIFGIRDMDKKLNPSPTKNWVYEFVYGLDITRFSFYTQLFSDLSYDGILDGFIFFHLPTREGIVERVWIGVSDDEELIIVYDDGASSEDG